MKKAEVLKQLKAMGSAQTRKTYANHGITGAMFGCKLGDMTKLVRQIKVDHELAMELWATKNFDAQVFATMIADPEQLTAKDLNAWVASVEHGGLVWAIASVAAKSPAGRKRMKTWTAAKREWPGAIGWTMVCDVAKAGDVDKAQAREWLADIEARIHDSANRVRYAMNFALIALGSHVPGLEREAVAAAKRIGPVDVDHGPTSCKTPLAAPAIQKAAAQRRARSAKKKSSAKKAGAR